EGRRILGSISASSVFPPHVPEGMIMFRTLLGGARHAKMAAAGDAELLTAAKAELAQLGCGPTRRPRSFRWSPGCPARTV
ncbi:unnamed protein product, partial [Laminaria digitata]